MIEAGRSPLTNGNPSGTHLQMECSFAAGQFLLDKLINLLIDETVTCNRKAFAQV